MEKYDWDRKLGEKLLRRMKKSARFLKRRENICPFAFLSGEILKLANYYYTHNKAWISEKMWKN